MYHVSVLLFFQLLTMYHSSLVTALGTNIVVSTSFPDTEELACHCSRLLPSLQGGGRICCGGDIRFTLKVYNKLEFLVKVGRIYK